MKNTRNLPVTKAWPEKTWFMECDDCGEVLEVGEGEIFCAVDVTCECGKEYWVEPDQ